MPLPLFTLRALTKHYPRQPAPALADVTLEIQEGEIFGLLGDNGAGKSTLVKQMVNLSAPTSGTIEFRGRPLCDDPMALALQVGYMPQDGLALNSLTVGEAIYFTAHLRGLSRADALREQARLLEMWQIGPIRDKVPQKLSGGQKRLMQLAVTMAGAPPVLILDEPTNELDPQRRKQVWDILRAENQHKGTTVIFITHDAIEAEKIIQRVGILHAGRLVAIGRPADLKRPLADRWKLELVFNPTQPPTLPATLTPIILAPDRWLFYLPRTEAVSLMQSLDMARLEDFRLLSPTLEDLYLHYSS